jgi:hypothetical protein
MSDKLFTAQLKIIHEHVADCSSTGKTVGKNTITEVDSGIRGLP